MATNKATNKQGFRDHHLTGSVSTISYMVINIFKWLLFGSLTVGISQCISWCLKLCKPVCQRQFLLLDDVMNKIQFTDLFVQYVNALRGFRLRWEGHVWIIGSQGASTIHSERHQGDTKPLVLPEIMDSFYTSSSQQRRPLMDSLFLNGRRCL